MSLLQSIVEQFDRELDRLKALRKLVAGLDHTPALVRRYTQPAPSAAVVVIAPAQMAEPARPKREARGNAGVHRGPPNPKPVREEGALARTMPSGPVVVYPQKLLSAKTAQAAPANREQSSKPVPDLDAESRRLAALWTAGLAS